MSRPSVTLPPAQRPRRVQVRYDRWVKIRRPLAVGDTVYLIGEVTEVGERVWFRGVSVTVQAFWAEPTFDDPKAPAALIRPIVHEWWVHISWGGRSGWIQAWNRNIEGTDACA